MSRLLIMWNAIRTWLSRYVNLLMERVQAVAIRLLGVKRVQWISRHLQIVFGFVPLLYWKYFGLLLALVLCVWKAHTLFACVQDTRLGLHDAKWNISSALPLPRRLVYDNGLGQTPIMGWSGWNKYECKINEKIVRANTDRLLELGLHQLGYNYIIVDDCWAAYKRDKSGRLRSHPKTFPSGMKALADHAHENDLKFGVYSDAGRRTCIGHRAGSEGHELLDAKTFAEWGIDFLKYDNCFHKDEASHIRYPVMSEALNKSGRPIFYTICEWGEDNPAIWAGKYANSWRTSKDIKDRWERIQYLADDNNVWAAYAGPGGWNDPDMLQVGNGRMSLAEYRSHFSIWSIMKAPLVIGCELRTIRDEHLEIYKNTEIIAVNQDPLGIQARKVSRQGNCLCREVWAGPLSGNRIVIVVWNRDWRAASIDVNWYDLGLEPDVSVKVRDLWQHEDWEGRLRGGFPVQVNSHDCGVFILSDISGAR